MPALTARLALMGVLALGAGTAFAQVTSLGATIENLAAGTRNGVSNLAVLGDSLFIGPKLQLRDDAGSFRALSADPVFNPPNAPDASIFALDVEGSTIWAALGFVDRASEGEPQSAAGFAISLDGGQTWRYQATQIDLQTATQQRYGVSVLPALPIIVPQQSAPFDLDYDPIRDELWVSGWASGTRKATGVLARVTADQPLVWERVVLPPDTLDRLDPRLSYDFPFAPERNSLEAANNFLGFAVLVDEAGDVWAGTAAGINRSTDADRFLFQAGTTIFEDRAWRRYGFDGTPRSLPGNFVIALDEQPLPGRNPVWVSAWTAEDQDERNSVSKVTVLTDSTVLIEPKLIDGGGAATRIYDFAFDGTVIYAAGAAGLYVSTTGGDTWRTIRAFYDADDPTRLLPLRPDATVFAVETLRTGAGLELWIGTGDGLLRSTDGGDTWTLFRANVPTRPATPTDAVPTVDAYAYPNPFSPQADGVVRFRYDLDAPATDVRLRIFDGQMNLVRTLPLGSRPAGAIEEVWDGVADDGTRLANAVYFYVIDADDQRFTGKLLVLE